MDAPTIVKRKRPVVAPEPPTPTPTIAKKKYELKIVVDTFPTIDNAIVAIFQAGKSKTMYSKIESTGEANEYYAIFTNKTYKYSFFLKTDKDTEKILVDKCWLHTETFDKKMDTWIRDEVFEGDSKPDIVIVTQ